MFKFLPILFSILHMTNASSKGIRCAFTGICYADLNLCSDHCSWGCSPFSICDTNMFNIVDSRMGCDRDHFWCTDPPICSSPWTGCPSSCKGFCIGPGDI